MSTSFEDLIGQVMHGSVSDPDVRELILEALSCMNASRLALISNLVGSGVLAGGGSQRSEDLSKWLNCLQSIYLVWSTPRNLVGSYVWDTAGGMVKRMCEILEEGVCKNEVERVRQVFGLFETILDYLWDVEMDGSGVACVVVRALREMRQVRFEGLSVVKSFVRKHEGVVFKELLEEGVVTMVLVILKKVGVDVRLSAVAFDVLKHLCNIEDGHQKILGQSQMLIFCMTRINSVHYDLDSLYSFVKSFVTRREIAHEGADGVTNWEIVCRQDVIYRLCLGVVSSERVAEKLLMLGDSFLRMSERSTYARQIFSNAQFQLLAAQIIKGKYDDFMTTTHWTELLVRIGVAETEQQFNQLSVLLRLREEPVDLFNQFGASDAEDEKGVIVTRKRKVDSEVVRDTVEKLESMVHELHSNQRSLMKKIGDFENGVHKQGESWRQRLVMLESHVEVLNQRLDNVDAVRSKLMKSNARLMMEISDLKDRRGRCVICLEVATQATIPCGHLIVCENCEWSIEDECSCPVCRRKLEGLLRVFI